VRHRLQYVPPSLFLFPLLPSIVISSHFGHYRMQQERPGTMSTYKECTKGVRVKQGWPWCSGGILVVFWEAPPIPHSLPHPSPFYPHTHPTTHHPPTHTHSTPLETTISGRCRAGYLCNLSHRSLSLVSSRGALWEAACSSPESPCRHFRRSSCPSCRHSNQPGVLPLLRVTEQGGIPLANQVGRHLAFPPPPLPPPCRPPSHLLLLLLFTSVALPPRSTERQERS